MEKQKAAKKAREEMKEETEWTYEIDWHDFVVVDTIDIEDDEEERPEYAPEVTLDLLGVKDVAQELDEEERRILNESEVEPGMKIVKDYKRERDQIEQTQRCPKCSRDIPQSQWEEHLRIELLDPKWREDKEEWL